MRIEIITKHDTKRTKEWQHTLIMKVLGEQIELPLEIAKSLPDEITRALGETSKKARVLPISGVNQRRELLEAFMLFYKHNIPVCTQMNSKQIVAKYLKSL